jgi:ClpP class serine protease
MGGEEKNAAASVGERDANRLIEEQLKARIEALEDASEADALSFVGPIYPMASEMIKDAVEALPDKRNSIVCLLETTGGLMDVVERIAIILRHHYKRVSFIVPSEAMSAGTILVMSGDSIYMDYASMLGPIDPQIQTNSGNWVPALGYLEQYDRLVEKADEGTLTSAELSYLIENFNPAELYRYEQERELSIALLEEWLAKYKFKNWRKTKTRGKKVTSQMRKDRAADIARKLSETSRWHSHSRGIPMEVLRRDLKLSIDDFGKDPGLGPAVQSYYHLLKDYNVKRDYFVVLHTRERYVGF